MQRTLTSYTALGTTLGLSFVIALSNAAEARSRIASPTTHVPREIVVKLKDSDRYRVAGAIQALERKLGENSVLAIRSLMTDASTHVFTINHDSRMNEALDALKIDPSVTVAEPNFRYHAFDDGAPLDVSLPNDPDFNKTWGLQNIGQLDTAGQAGKAGADIKVLPLWQEGIRGSRKILVAVIDTGIDWDHPDLKDNLYTNPGESGPNADPIKDNDHNGFINDIHGWNFNARNNDSRDDQKHGSHCAGTIGATGNNGIGVAGVNWETSLLPVKFLDKTGGGTLDAAIESINYATMMKVNVMSNSWGGGGSSDIMKASIQKARDAGILFIAAAGNDSGNNDSTPSYPASYELDNVISVAATDNRDALASFSNFGARTVHVAAPGVKIYSTTMGGKYEALSGTSMATPHVAGIAALLLSVESTLSPTQVKDRLIRSSDPVKGLKRKVVANGRVNVYNAVHRNFPISNEPDSSLWKSETRVIESEHPYKEGTDVKFTVQRPGAKFIRVHFEKIEVENRYDSVTVQSSTDEVAEEVTGMKQDYTSEYIEGDTAVIRLKSDLTVNSFGFKIDRVDYIE